jgi:hypothetical protein
MLFFSVHFWAFLCLQLPGYQWTLVRRGISDNSYTVSGLRGDRDYRFRIRPETHYGPGEYSLPVHAYRKPCKTLCAVIIHFYLILFAFVDTIVNH